MALGHLALLEQLRIYDIRISRYSIEEYIPQTRGMSAVDVWDWPFDWVEEMPALTEEEAAQLPWNFEWNFNWLRFPWKSNLEVLRQEQQNNLDQMRELASSWKDDFRNWVIEEKFGGNVAEADAHHRVLVDENKKEKQREAARRGLLLNV